MENPDTNGTARLVSMVSVSFVVISTCCMCLGTIQSLQVRLEDGTLTDNIVIETLETLSVFWFSLEYLLRLLSCPDKWDFLGDKLNFLDVAAVLPFYVPLGLSWVETVPTASRNNFLPPHLPLNISSQIEILQIISIFDHTDEKFSLAQKHLRL